MARELQPTDEDSVWMADAACVGADIDMFFSGRGSTGQNICRTCPVISECLDYSLIFEEHGVWGGLSENKRRKKYPNYVRDAMREDYIILHE